MFYHIQKLLISSALCFSSLFASDIDSDTDQSESDVSQHDNDILCTHLTKLEAREALMEKLPEYYTGGGKIIAPAAVINEHTDLINAAQLSTSITDQGSTPLTKEIQERIERVMSSVRHISSEEEISSSFEANEVCEQQ